MVARIGSWCYHHRRSTVVGWIVGAALIFLLSGAIGSDYNGEFSTPDSESTEGFESLQRTSPNRALDQSGQHRLPGRAGRERSAVKAAMEELFASPSQAEGFSVVSPYSRVRRTTDLARRHDRVRDRQHRQSIDQTASGSVGEELVRRTP